jgi:hypothetical protein
MIENRHLGETKTTFLRGARINRLVRMAAKPMQRARALAVTAEYSLVLGLLTGQMLRFPGATPASASVGDPASVPSH